MTVAMTVPGGMATGGTAAAGTVPSAGTAPDGTVPGGTASAADSGRRDSAGRYSAGRDGGRRDGGRRDSGHGDSGRRDSERRDSGGRDGEPPRLRLPTLPASITADQLDPAARAELRTLPSDLAESVARFLVAAAHADDAERGYEYALAARKLAARVGIVRETCGIAAYRAGKWAEALAELRAARRLTGQGSYLPMMADSERALGRLDRALDLVTGPEASGLSG